MELCIMATYSYNIVTICCNLKLYFTLSLVLAVLRYPASVLSITTGAFEDAPVVRVTEGYLIGKRVSLNANLKPVDQYLGVPYAMPPVGHLRFRAPHTPPPSYRASRRNATTFAPACLQLVMTPDQTADMPGWKRIPLEEKWPFLRELSEDCLYLNIYVPTRGESNDAIFDSGEKTRTFAVMVFIHGGNYNEGSGNMYDGSILASYGDVIVVTVNYRLGILGFLSTGDAASRGNYGLRDQLAALKWINANIANFGGDPERVALIGSDSGASSVGFLMMSNLTKGLVHNIIAQSGSALATWALTQEPKSFARRAGKELGCTAIPSLKLVDCMRQLPASSFENLKIQAPLYFNAFAPVIDGELIREDPKIFFFFFSRKEANISCGCSYLTGVSRTEAFDYVGDDVDGAGQIEVSEYQRILDGFVQNHFGGTMQAGEVIKEAINYEYRHWDAEGPESNKYTLTDTIVDVLSDHEYVAPAVETAKYLARGEIDVYFYVFGHKSKNDIYPKWTGSVHEADLGFVFGAPLVPGTMGMFSLNYTKGDAPISLAVMNYWTNFAKSGNPNDPRPQSVKQIHRDFKVTDFKYDTLERWPTYGYVPQFYTHIGSTPRLKEAYRLHKLKFWEELVPGVQSHFPESQFLPDPILPGPIGGGDGGHKIQPTDNKIPDPHVTPLPDASGRPEKSFMVELSMVIACGGFLLLLNVIVLGGIYYLRDKRKLEAKLAAKYLAQQEEKKRQDNKSDLSDDRPITMNHAPVTGTHSNHSGLSSSKPRSPPVSMPQPIAPPPPAGSNMFADATDMLPSKSQARNPMELECGGYIYSMQRHDDTEKLQDAFIIREPSKLQSIRSTRC
ncbi:neuroligin-4, X-linked-like [Amphiura filiformis]|uniref:neuroligin-4, X-linked-like n=1 Tax=Amphiura filiformis TaxID=82378 RepID=UPI003B227F0D